MPEMKELPEGVIEKVGSNVGGGWVRIMKGGPVYRQMFKTPGAAAPTPQEFDEEAVCIPWRRMKQGKKTVVVGSGYIGVDDATSIDIYMRAEGRDGKVRMDI